MKHQFLTRYTKLNTSTDYKIENVMIKVDLISLDNSLQNSYDAHLLAGSAYPINFNTSVIGGMDRNEYKNGRLTQY